MRIRWPLHYYSLAASLSSQLQFIIITDQSVRSFVVLIFTDLMVAV
jgi:hypothetical protein